MLQFFRKCEIRVSVRSTLICICVIPALMVLGNIGYFATEIRSHLIHAELEDNRTTAEMVATQTRYVIDSVASHLYALSTMPDLRYSGGEMCTRILQGVLDNLKDPKIQLPLDRLARVTPEGILDCNTTEPGTKISVRDRSYFTQPRETNQYAVTNLMRGRLSNTFIVVVAVPIQMLTEGRPDTGVLVTGMTTTWMSDVLAKLNSGEETWMIDSGGMIVAAYPAVEAAGQAMPNYNQISRHTTGTTSGVAFLDLDGVPYTLAYAQIPNTPFKVLVLETAESIYQPIQKIMLIMALIILTLTGFGAAVTWTLCRRFFLTPLNQLIENTHRIRTGDFSAHADLPTSVSELMILGHAAAEMVQALSLKEEIIQAQIRNLEEMAFYDRLTGLANMRLFRRDLDLAVRRIERCGGFLVVFNIDLNGLKRTNDTFGHEAGDHLLQASGHRIAASIRPTDTAARNGGDEFLVLMLAPSLEAATETGRRLVRNLHQPIALEQGVIQGMASVGMAWLRDGPEDVEFLLKRADQAMYRAKAASHKHGCSAFHVCGGDLLLVDQSAAALEPPPTPP